MEIVTKRIYESADPGDGFRVLVDRLWPRGVSREQAALAMWAKDLAPSPELRKWFSHKPERFEEFAERYRAELDSQKQNANETFAAAAEHSRITLLFAAKDMQHNHAAILQEWLLEEEP